VQKTLYISYAELSQRQSGNQMRYMSFAFDASCMMASGKQ